MRIRILDIFISLLGLIIGSPILLTIYICTYCDTGSPLFVQSRVGRYGKVFKLIKFRSMKIEAPSLPTHLVDTKYISSFGSILRKSKLDELPQLWNVLIGDMSLVGPRPCLPSQKELINERQTRGIYDFRPGVTGLAQIMGINMSTPKLLAETDEVMLSRLTVSKYFQYILNTLIR